MVALPALVLYTDGACLGNPGPGGWAAVILDGVTERAVWGCDAATTNQRMEQRAVLEGFRALDGSRAVTVCSDSAYVVNGFVQRWHVGWARNGWRNAKGQPVANRELWEALIEQAVRHRVTWRWVPGHAGDPLNERADELATRAAREQSTGSSAATAPAHRGPVGPAPGRSAGPPRRLSRRPAGESGGGGRIRTAE